MPSSDTKLSERLGTTAGEPLISKGTSLSDQTYEYVKHLILTLQLSPGIEVQEAQIAKHLGISRSPVRHAVTKLESEGLVQCTPWRSPRVTQISPKYVTELYQVRAALESAAARLSTPNISDEELAVWGDELRALEHRLADDPDSFYTDHEVHFHDLFISRCNNELIKRMLTGLKDHLLRVRNYLSSIELPGHVEISFEEHEMILAALLSGDPASAQRAVQCHLDGVRERIVSQMTAQGTEKDVS